MQGFSKIIALMCLMFCTSSFADAYDDPNNPNMPLQGYKYCYMLGFDLNYQILHPRNDFVYTTFNHRLGSDIYAAWRSRGPFGLELGYHWTNDKVKNIITVPGTPMFGAISGRNGSYGSSLRVTDTYIDAYWHYKIKKIVEVKFGVGVGWVKQDLKFFNLEVDPVSTALRSLYTHTTAVGRLNIGLQTMITKRIGARALVGYQTTSRVTCGNVLAGTNPHMFANSYLVSLGLYYTITGYYDDNPGPNGEFLN